MTQPVLPDTLYGMAADLLLKMKACFLNQGLSLPARELIFMSPIVQDCEQVAVVFSGWTPNPPWDTTTVCDNFRWMASFSCLVTRCTPALPSKDGRIPPTADMMKEAAQIASEDAEAMICVVHSIGELGPDLQIITHAPLGGLQTVELIVTLPAFGA